MRFSALGDSAIVAECGDDRSTETLRQARDFAEAVERAHLPGVVDIVAAFGTVTVFYDPNRVAVGATDSAYARMVAELTRVSGARANSAVSSSKLTNGEVVIPVGYGGEHGPDLAALAEKAGLSVADAISLHSGASYVVHAIGFSPGFPYLAGLPEKLSAERLRTPRTAVPAGSVGIGGAQTGIYPLATPGGWQLIGRTPLRLFDPQREPPALLQVGNRVRFRPISPAEFNAARAQSPLRATPSAAEIGSGVKVMRPGALTTVQDLGRVGHRAAGVPMGGAADVVAARVANWLVGNSAGAATLEFTLVGPELEFISDALVAIGGADFGAIPRWQPMWVAAGTRLRFGAAREGCRGYLAVAGGFKVPPVLGSASTELRANFGGWQGRALREGDILPAEPHARRVSGHWRIDERILPAYSPTPTIRVVRGAQAEQFSEAWLENEFTVTPRSDRMGLRLMGSPLPRRVAGELLSTAVAPGTIQVPADGQPIALLADAQTIGGYPQLAHAITVDLPLLAQLKPGDRIRFRVVTVEDAQRLLLAREHALAILHEGLTQKLS